MAEKNGEEGIAAASLSAPSSRGAQIVIISCRRFPSSCPTAVGPAFHIPPREPVERVAMCGGARAPRGRGPLVSCHPFDVGRGDRPVAPAAAWMYARPGLDGSASYQPGLWIPECVYPPLDE